MLLVPQLSAERFFPVHVDMVESFGRHVSLVLDDRAFGSLQIRKPGATGRLYTPYLRLSNLRFRQSEHTTRTRPSIAADEHVSAFVGRVKWKQFNVGPLFVDLEILPHIRDVPAEVPDRCLWLEC